ncbi:hypothetical protein CRENBAI_009051 [Crenichthys baileyi]|uniref:Uncharacterized protein n=1 Tax=Crenichthys baileyi TaxID=28760 RepID=A0AAV9QTB2_9TELE
MGNRIRGRGLNRGPEHRNEVMYGYKNLVSITVLSLHIRSDRSVTASRIQSSCSLYSSSSEFWKQLPTAPAVSLMDHLAIAHLPVHPPSVCAQLKHCRLRITKRERQHCESPCYSSYQTQPLWGRLTTLNKPSSTTNMPVQIPLPDPVRVQSHSGCVKNKLLTAVLPHSYSELVKPTL